MDSDGRIFNEVDINILAGQTIDGAIDYAIKFHKENDCIVNFKFNNTPIAVNSFYNEKGFLSKYFYYRSCPNGRY